jgi:hypothetical protein
MFFLILDKKKKGVQSSQHTTEPVKSTENVHKVSHNLHGEGVVTASTRDRKKRLQWKMNVRRIHIFMGRITNILLIRQY